MKFGASAGPWMEVGSPAGNRGPEMRERRPEARTEKSHKGEHERRPPVIDQSHNPKKVSWVTSANGHRDFPIQNLPLGIFSDAGGSEPRGGVAIGDMVLDLLAAAELGCLRGLACEAARATQTGRLNDLFGVGPEARRALRAQVSELLDADGPEKARANSDASRILRPGDTCVLHLPFQIGDYTDFYAGIHHATHAGKLFRPQNPLTPNYKHVPIGYHGRASSIVPSGRVVTRPSGQIKDGDTDHPRFSPSERVDYELELGIWIGAGNPLGQPVPIGEAQHYVAGYCLLNDWSARDIQSWEYQPLGPFLAKSFSTTVSPWVITPEALAPFRIAQPPRGINDPAPLPYLQDQEDQRAGALDLDLEVLIVTAAMRKKGIAPCRVALTSSRHLYWTPAQLVAHHTSNGCNLRSGDLLGSGTISGPNRIAVGCLLEATHGGKEAVPLEGGEERRFLENDDEVILRARTHPAPGYIQIGFGECRGRLVGSHR